MTAGQPSAVLLVDDDAGKRLALRASLRSLGCVIVEADSGRAALRCLLEQEFAVILLDVRMPDMNGFETAALIRQRKQSELTPIIFVTANSTEELDEATRYSAGAVDFIYSPIAPEELRAKVTVFAGLQSRAATLVSEAQEARTSADDLRLLTEAAPIGIFRTDGEGRYLYTNPHWSEITGIPPEDAEGLALDAILGTELDDDPAERGRRFELRLPGVLGTRILHLVTSVVPAGERGAGGCVGTLADITAEAGAEVAMATARDEATAMSRTKSDFLANMSHELRTPMCGVIGMTDLLLETGLDSRQRDYAQTVRNSSEALMKVLNDILDFSKVEVGKLEVEAIEYELRTLVEDVAALLAGVAQAKGLELVVAVDRGVPALAVGDPGRVRQVLTNLIGNAIKFTHEGEVVVRVSSTDSGRAGGHLRFEITDTGDGIAPEKLDLIFQPFVQADTSTSRKYGGTGLGLAISSELVALMGGECGVMSRLGEGSEFWFTLQDETQRTLPPALAGDAMVGVRALLVEPNATQRDVLDGYLQEAEVDVCVAASAVVAADALQAAVAVGTPFDVVLVAGADLARAIASLPDMVTPLVVLIEQEDAHDEAYPAVPKPVRRDALLTAVRGVLHPKPPPAVAAPVQAPTPRRAASGRVLVAEDNPINRKVAVAMLAGTGYEVDTVVDGKEAVEAATRQFYDAILMDCQMPELNGYEATAQIRAEEGRRRHTPIIALTAGARREDRERCLAEGMDGYLAKPVNREALLAVLAESLKPGSTATPAYGPTIDRTVLEELRLAGGDRPSAFVSDAIEQFTRDSEPCLVDLRIALDRHDHGAVARCALRLKDSCDRLGARRLAASCARLEHKASIGHLHTSRIDLEEVEVDYEDLRRALATELLRLSQAAVA